MTGTPSRMGDLSPFVRAALPKLHLANPSHVLDLPCGFGRHSMWLSDLGHSVVAADLDRDRLFRLCNLREQGDRISCVATDASQSLPFRAGSFDLALVVHFIAGGLIERVLPLLRRGGFLIFETFGAQGSNWRDLPAPGSIRRQLAAGFELMDYKERGAGLPQDRRAVVRALARRK